MAEEGRVSIRHARRVGNDDVKQAIKDHETGEDEGRRELEDIQKITDEYSQKIEEMLQAKEKEVMAI